VSIDNRTIEESKQHLLASIVVSSTAPEKLRFE